MSKATPKIFYMTCTMSALLHIIHMLSPNLDQKDIVSFKRFVGEVQIIEMTIDYLMYKAI